MKTIKCVINDSLLSFQLSGLVIVLLQDKFILLIFFRLNVVLTNFPNPKGIPGLRFLTSNYGFIDPDILQLPYHPINMMLKEQVRLEFE